MGARHQRTCGVYWRKLLVKGLSNGQFLTVVCLRHSDIQYGSKMIAGFLSKQQPMDIRSDNICISGAKVIFVDWSHAARGSGRYDLAYVLSTLHLEGGPAPYQVMPDGGCEAALLGAGHIKRLMTDGSMPDWLKKVFRQLIGIELQWAAQCLGLDEPAQ